MIEFLQKIPINGIVKGVCVFAKENAGPISTGAVALGIVTTFLLAAKAGSEAKDDCEEMKEELEVDELTFGEKFKASWKRFIPAVFMMLLTISCLVYTTNRMMKRYAALSAAYTMTENYLREYTESTKAITGPKKEQAIRDEANIKQAQKTPVNDRGIIETGHGDDLFFDAVITTRYFRSSLEQVKNVEKELAGIYNAEDELKLDEYTYRLGLGTRSSIGNYIGWRKTGKYDETSKFGLYYTSGIADTGEPYIIISQGANRLTDLTR